MLRKLILQLFHEKLFKLKCKNLNALIKNKTGCLLSHIKRTKKLQYELAKHLGKTFNFLLTRFLFLLSASKTKSKFK